MNKDIQKYNDSQTDSDKEICELLQKTINENLPNSESKIWHAHPVWFWRITPLSAIANKKTECA